MKLIDIQRHFFRIRGNDGLFFCTEAEHDFNLNVKAVHFIRVTAIVLQAIAYLLILENFLEYKTFYHNILFAFIIIMSYF